MNNLNRVLRRIAECQSTSSPVDLSVGGTTESGQVTHDEIIVRSAPPRIVTMLVTEFEFVSCTTRGLRIHGTWDNVGESTP